MGGSTTTQILMCVFGLRFFVGESFKGSLLGKSFQKPGSPRGVGVNVKKKQVTEVSDVYWSKDVKGSLS